MSSVDEMIPPITTVAKGHWTSAPVAKQLDRRLVSSFLHTAISCSDQPFFDPCVDQLNPTATDMKTT